MFFWHSLAFSISFFLGKFLIPASYTVSQTSIHSSSRTLSRSSCEEILHAQGQRRSPSKMVGGANSSSESSPIPARDTQRAQTNLVHQDPGTPQRRDGTVLSISCDSLGQEWTATGTGTLGVADLRMA